MNIMTLLLTFYVKKLLYSTQITIRLIPRQELTWASQCHTHIHTYIHTYIYTYIHTRNFGIALAATPTNQLAHARAVCLLVVYVKPILHINSTSTESF